MSFNYGLRPITINNITMPSTPASTATAAFGSQTEYVRVCSPVDCHIVFGGTATIAPPTASATSIFIPADQPEIFKVTPGSKCSGLSGTNGDVISIVELSA
jgi:hypothetical protein